LEGVIGGIDFLKDVALGNEVNIGDKVAIVGGGNTAMDACRVAVRLGASKVYNIYRRTKNEMPAEEIEIIEAEEEGVIFRNLTNPIEVVGDNGKVSAVRLQIMELGEPDASGRRSPVAVEGKEETIALDSIIVAIGQKTDSVGLESLEHTSWKTIKADEHTFLTNIDKVFAIGDATNDGADIAITAIAEAGKAADMIDKFLRGEELVNKDLFLVKDEKTAEDFADKEKIARAVSAHRSAEGRRNDFLVYDSGFTAEQAIKEASRCLKCGCLDYHDCKLIKYSNQYDVAPEKYAGQVHCRAESDDIPNIHRTPDKCILCGLCVRLCEESVGAGVLGFVNRGFDTIVQPAGDLSPCESCGECAKVCPTGALMLNN
ncbi:MAG: FAD-dependent oxidoreductase, partial [Oscillospiraceae bacterium]|nr:FAD-dependent oxidoreductase [Oscillospiraceae bacterium]